MYMYIVEMNILWMAHPPEGGWLVCSDSDNWFQYYYTQSEKKKTGNRKRLSNTYMYIHVCT